MFTQELLWMWLVHATIIAGVVLTACYLVLRALREPTHRLRVIQWTLVGCLVAPLLNSVDAVPHWSLGWLSSVEATERDADGPTSPAIPSFTLQPDTGSVAVVEDVDDRSSEVIDLLPVETPATLTAKSSADAADSETGPSWSLSACLIGFYLATASLICLQLFVGLARRSWIQLRSRAADGSLRDMLRDVGGSKAAHVRLLISDQVDSPMAWGVVRPVILLPADLAEQPNSDETRWSLAHEWAHIEHRDIYWLPVAGIATLVCFYQPLFWWLRRQLFLCQDFLADARAASETGTNEDYAEFLLGIARSRSQLPAAALGIADRRSSLTRRVERLVAEPAGYRIRPLATAAIGLGAVALLSAVSVIRLDAADEQRENPVAPAALADDEPGEVGVVVGTIVNAADNTPISDVQVRLRGNRLYRATTDKEGRFRFEKIPTGEFRIWARKGELVCGIERFHNIGGSSANEARFKPVAMSLKPGKTVRITVVSQATGRPLEGADLRLDYPFRRHIKTAADGTATFVGLMSEQYRLSAEAKSHAAIRRRGLDMKQAFKSTEITLKLAAGGVVRGVVTDNDGKPLKRANVVFRAVGTPYGFYGTSPYADEKGEFRNNHLPLDTTIEVSFSLKDYERVEREVTLTAEKREVNLAIKLSRRPRGGSIAGVVVDHEGTPIANATVGNFNRNLRDKREAKTDQQGRFKLNDLYEGYAGHEILVQAKGFAPMLQKVEPGSPDKPIDVKVTLPPGHTLRGRVVDGDGKPIPAAFIAYGANGVPGRIGDTIRSDDNGMFDFDSLPADVMFMIYADGYSSLSNQHLELDQDERIIVTLEAAGAISGRVLDAETSEPIKEFRVRLGFSRDQRPGDASGSYDSRLGEPGVDFSSKTGRFKIEELINRMPFEVTILADGYEKVVLPRIVATNKPIETLPKITLKKLDPNKLFTLRGQVVDFQKRPVGETQLRLLVTDVPSHPNDNELNWLLVKSGQLARRSVCQQFLSAVADSKGRFEFKGVLPGKHIHLAYWGDRVPQGRWYAKDQTKPGAMNSITIALPEPSAIVGTIDLSKYADAGRIHLSKTDEAWHGYELELKEGTKEFRFETLPPGSYSIAVQSKPERTAEGSFRLRPLAQHRLRLGVGETREISFEASDRIKPVAR